MKLTIDAVESANATVLTVTGEVDMESSPKLRDEIKKIVKKKPATLKLRMKDVPYIDSSGIAVLIEGMRWCRKDNIDFVLAGISESVRGVLQLSKLLPVFKVEEG
jgi:anti-sigma B factor antagonist